MAIDDNTSYELTGAQVKDLASKINAKANSASLATVATSGSYSDLSNKPTIGNATITIQKNGTSAGTFTTNATSNKSINITVPTTAADVSALPASTKYAASLTMSIDSSTHVVTTTLKDQDGNTLGTAQTIDLPLESVVVNGSYDSATKKIILTLQNGNTIEFSVADLVSGLQSEITSSNKLASDLVDDTGQTNKFMTSAEKTKLSGIATGAEVNVQSDWDVSDNTSDAFIKNKPTIPVVDASLSTSSTNAIQNKAVATALDDKVDVASVNLTNQTTTILAQVQALGAAQKNYGRFYSKTDAGSANISDKPTGATNASFVCIAYQSRNNGTSDYTYQVLCWVQADTNPYKTTVTASSSSITWTRLQPTVNNATLTIQKNGTTVETFTANSSSNKTANISVPTKVSDITSDVGGNTFIGTSDTAVATAAKTVTVPAAQNFVLTEGAMVTFKAPGTNTAENPTLEVNGTGAKSIWYNTAVITTSSLNRAGQSGRYATYLYDGTYWVWVSWGTDDNTTYSTMSVSEGKTGTATNARTMRADYLKQIIDAHIRTADNLSPTADTTAAWATALGDNGHYYTWYSAASKFTNQPSTYGFLESFKNGSDIYQRWHSQSSGPILYRSGNANGWSNPSDGTWNTVATTSQVPTKTSDLTNDGDDGVHPYLATDDVATVATTGDYDDLTDKPTIGNATLTIQKNGSTVDTFTANATSNKTINLTMPNITVQDTDPGEGVALAADNYIGVYDIPASPIDGSRLITGSVPTAALADSAVTTAKIADGAITRAKVDATSYSATAEGNWAVSYLPNGKKMWIQSGNWGPSGSFTPGGQNYAFVTNIATLPASLADFSGIHIIGTAQSSTPSCQCDFVWNSTFVGGTTKFGLRLHEWYGSGSVTRSGTFSLVLIEK